MFTPISRPRLRQCSGSERVQRLECTARCRLRWRPSSGVPVKERPARVSGVYRRICLRNERPSRQPFDRRKRAWMRSPHGGQQAFEEVHGTRPQTGVMGKSVYPAARSGCECGSGRYTALRLDLDAVGNGPASHAANITPKAAACTPFGQQKPGVQFYFADESRRSTHEITPVERLWSNPNGLPIANVFCPTCTSR